jgi:signal transduction histidine kinase
MLLNATLSQVNLPPNIETRIEISDNIPSILADGQLLKRVFFNLFTNAVQAMPKGGKLTLGAKKAARGKTGVIVTVQDTGEGIPENVKPKMSKPLFTTKSKGQGFGLAVCKRVIEAHGGTIAFYSKEGLGTRFTVELPA